MNRHNLAEAIVDALEPHLVRNAKQYESSDNMELRAAAAHFRKVRTQHVELVAELIKHQTLSQPSGGAVQPQFP